MISLFVFEQKHIIQYSLKIYWCPYWWRWSRNSFPVLTIEVVLPSSILLFYCWELRLHSSETLSFNLDLWTRLCTCDGLNSLLCWWYCASFVCDKGSFHCCWSLNFSLRLSPSLRKLCSYCSENARKEKSWCEAWPIFLYSPSILSF